MERLAAYNNALLAHADNKKEGHVHHSPSARLDVWPNAGAPNHVSSSHGFALADMMLPEEELPVQVACLDGVQIDLQTRGRTDGARCSCS
jgi:hypothetical protein